MFTLGYGTLGYVALGYKARVTDAGIGAAVDQAAVDQAAVDQAAVDQCCSEPTAPQARASSAGESPPEHLRRAGGGRAWAVFVGDCLRMCQEKPRDASLKPIRALQHCPCGQCPLRQLSSPRATAPRAAMPLCPLAAMPLCALAAMPLCALAAMPLCPLAAMPPCVRAATCLRPEGSSSIEVVITQELHRRRSVSFARPRHAELAGRRVASRLQQCATAVSVWLMEAEKRCTTFAPRLRARRCSHPALPSLARTALTPRSAGRVNEVRLS